MLLLYDTLTRPAGRAALLSEDKVGLTKPAVREPFKPGVGLLSAKKGLNAAVDTLADVLSKFLQKVRT